MKTVTVTVPPEVKAVLAQVVYAGRDLLRLPPGLPRPLYVATDKVLVAMGGKWDRRREGHVFPGDPRPKVAEALGGELVDEKKTFQAFYTPSPVAQLVVGAMTELGATRHRVLEPSAGHGALALAVLDRFPFAEITAVDLDPKACLVLRKLNGIERVADADFMDCVPEIGRAKAQLGLFDAVVMNPPFTGGQDVEHVMHAWSFVVPGGQLLAIVAPAFKFREGARWDLFRDAHERYCRVEEALPDGAFTAAGTGVRTILIAWRKP